MLGVIPLSDELGFLFDLALERHVFVVLETAARIPVPRVEPVDRVAQASDQLDVRQMRTDARRGRRRVEIRGGRLPYRFLRGRGPKVRAVRLDPFLVASIEEMQLLLLGNEHLGMPSEI